VLLHPLVLLVEHFERLEHAFGALDTLERSPAGACAISVDTLLAERRGLLSLGLDALLLLLQPRLEQALELCLLLLLDEDLLVRTPPEAERAIAGD